MKRLIDILSQEDTVIFVGSGISLWSGLPTWHSLIEELAVTLEYNGQSAELVKSEANKGDLLQAASYGFDKLSKAEIGDFIRKICRYGTAVPNEIHKKIVTLGPRCFITTNYDDLIEQSLRKWQPDRFYKPPVTNRHLTETAEIVHAKATDYIFKPHGDASDASSIVLTREQYRELLPQGGKYSTSETLKMIMTTRPVVYLGFGLRDPDFLLMRDLLANTYGGGTRDHYAIMADISNEESNYWRKHYGIHLVNYCTIERPDHTRDHSPLLTLLDDMSKYTTYEKQKNIFDPQSAHVILSLARYAAGMARSNKLNTEFEINVHVKKSNSTDSFIITDKYDGKPVNDFLINGPEKAALIGLPGAGKSYALNKAASKLAEDLNKVCLSESFDDKVIIPLFADMKLYRGDIVNLINQSLPPDISLDEILKHFRTKIFIDSFNEMPKEYWENASYESDFENFINKSGDAFLIIGSRTNDGLAKFNLPEYYLNRISKSTIEEWLCKLKISFEGRFINEIYILLQRPFYFQYVLNGKVNLPREAHPRDFYENFFENLNTSFLVRFKKSLSLTTPLSISAYNSLNKGEEAFPITDLVRIFKKWLVDVDLIDLEPNDIINWLVDSSILIPYTGGRVAFVHQSITEYLAAKELTRQYKTNSYLIQEKLSLKRWDQALFLALSLMPSNLADKFLEDIIAVDFILALNAVKYLEFDREEIVSKLLIEVPKQHLSPLTDEFAIAHSLSTNVPVTQNQEKLLRKILKLNGILGGAAAELLVNLNKASIKDEFLDLMFKESSDYNFCMYLGRSICDYATVDDVKLIAAKIDKIEETVKQSEDDDRISALTNGIAEFLEKIDLEILIEILIPVTGDIKKVRAEILQNILWNKHSTQALNLAGELLLRGIDEAATTIYFIDSFGNSESSDSSLSWEMFNEHHVKRFIDIIAKPNENWGVNGLQCLCKARPDLVYIVERIAETKNGILKIALLYCISSDNIKYFFDVLEDLTNFYKNEIDLLHFEILNRVKLDWENHGELFVKCLRLRNAKILGVLSGGSIPVKINNLSSIEIGQIDWWLEWITDLESLEDGKWKCGQLGSILARYCSKHNKGSLIQEFNNNDSKFRTQIKNYVLPYLSNLSINDFNDNTISYLLAELNEKIYIPFFRGNILGKTATENFIIDRILPLLKEAKEPLLTNLKKITREAGERHGRRYF